jgi:DNA polymerase-2
MWKNLRGWLFDLYPSEKGITLWIIDKDGNKIKGYAPFIPHFFMHVKDSEKPHVENVARKLRCTVSKGWIHKTEIYSGKQIPVLEISMSDTLHFKEVVRRFESEFPYYVFFNSDLTPVQMFLYERNLFPLAFGEYIFSRRDGFPEDDMLLSVELQDRFDAIDYTVPPLGTMTLKPSRTDTAPKYRHNLTLEVGYDSREYLIEAETIEEVLREINAHILRFDPDVILSQYGDDTLLPLLTEWSRKTRIPLYLNRDSSVGDMKTAEVSYWTYGKIVHRSAGFQLAGRWHIDTENSFILGESDLSGLLDLARITRIPVQKQARTSIGTGLSSMQLNWAYQHNILIPAKKQEWEKFKSALVLLLADRGGLIYLPIMGYHEQVAELDFTSMYPTIMYIHNVSPETVNCNCCSNNSVPELHYTICEKRRGIIPETIGAVLEKRAEYKKRQKNAANEKIREEYHKRQTALKWMLVTTFGYLGYKNARFGKIEAHESVNAFARDGLLRAKKIAEAGGFSVVHGIVDCLWLKKSGATPEEYEKLCDEISEQTGISISFEGIYKWILFPESRMDSAIPTANHYIGAYTNGEVKVRGLEVRRRDVPEFVQKMQGEVIELMSKASGIEELKSIIPSIMEIVRSHLELLRTGRVSPYELIIRHTISKDADEYENNSVQAVVARAMSEAGVALKPGETAEYIIVDHTGKKNPVKAKPFIFYRPEDGYDVEKYTELALKSIEVLLEPLGYTYEMIEKNAGVQSEKMVGAKSYRFA